MLPIVMPWDMLSISFLLAVGIHFAASTSESIIQKYIINNHILGPMDVCHKSYSGKTNGSLKCSQTYFLLTQFLLWFMSIIWIKDLLSILLEPGFHISWDSWCLIMLSLLPTNISGTPVLGCNHPSALPFHSNKFMPCLPWSLSQECSFFSPFSIQLYLRLYSPRPFLFSKSLWRITCSLALNHSLVVCCKLIWSLYTNGNSLSAVPYPNLLYSALP